MASMASRDKALVPERIFDKLLSSTFDNLANLCRDPHKFSAVSRKFIVKSRNWGLFCILMQWYSLGAGHGDQLGLTP